MIHRSSKPNSQNVTLNPMQIMVISISVVALLFASAKIGLGASHGVGLCMTGVKIKAQAGQGYEQILEYYYTGAEMTSGEPDREIKAGVYSTNDVLVLRPTSNYVVDPVGLTGGASDSVSIKWVNGLYEITLSNGQVGTTATPPIINANGSGIYVNGWTGWNGIKTDTLKVKGRIEARFSDKDGKLWAVNLIGLEDYVAGMLEEPDGWPMEGLKVLAVAARTYAIYKQTSTKHGTGIPMCATGDCQQYMGDWAGPNHKIAASQTAGQVIKYNGAIIVAAYSGYCGGYTKSNTQAWGGTLLPYLSGVPCVCAGTSVASPPGNIRGFLVDYQTRKGITGAAVRVADKIVPTIASGEFSITGVPAGEQTVYYDAPGYEGQTQVGIIVASNLTTKTPTCLLSPPTGSIIGRVVNASGKPILGALTRIQAARIVPNANGDFSYTKVNNGSYVLSYEAPGYVSQEQVILVQRGQVVRCPTCLLSEPGGVITGRVLNFQMRPITGAIARIDASAAGVKPDGSFSFTKVWDGNYMITYEAPGHEPQTQVIAVSTGKTTNCPACLLNPLGEIAGRVINAQGATIPGTCIRINSSLMPTNPGGEFRFTLVRKGTYTLYYDAPGHKGQQQEIAVDGGQTRCPTVILST